MARERLDTVVVHRGLLPTREKARAAIMAGMVTVDGQVEDKPGHGVRPDSVVAVARAPHPYVSRGGVKLEAALRSFAVDVSGCVAADLGASTGGFTDCLLQHGAARVYAVDVGRGQLDARLVSDPRVVVLDDTNARALTPGDLPELVDMVTMDLSFISLTKVMPAVRWLLSPTARAVIALVKPQFEAGRDAVGRKGVVRDPAVWRSCIERVGECARPLGLHAEGVVPSPIRGPKGNTEFLLLLRPISSTGDDDTFDEALDAAIEAAQLL
ncbi:MAG TPA: TlyA family RNA methyltransferase [Armatimonadota bacterium]|nr:TlyA family RNA methyltransferase [Armatimonadota bacterium]